MKSLIFSLISIVCVAASAAELQSTGAGIEISAGSLGSFIALAFSLSFPLVLTSKPAVLA